MGLRIRERFLVAFLFIVWLLWIFTKSESEIKPIINSEEPLPPTPNNSTSTSPKPDFALVSYKFQLYKGKFENSSLLERIRKHHLTPPVNRSVPYNLPGDDPHDDSAHPDHSKFHDMLMRIVLRKQRLARNMSTGGGFFVEAGASDGHYLSHTLDLERFHGWSGLLVEPSPNMVPQLKDFKRKSWIADVCLTEKVYLKAKHISVSRNEASAFMMKAMGQLAPAGKQNVGLGDDVNLEGVLECFSLYSLLKALNGVTIKVVDLLVLDIGGRELKILDEYPFQLLPITVVAVDHSHWPASDRVKYESDMKTIGYVLEYRSKSNSIFTLG